MRTSSHIIDTIKKDNGGRQNRAAFGGHALFCIVLALTHFSCGNGDIDAVDWRDLATGELAVASRESSGSDSACTGRDASTSRLEEQKPDVDEQNNLSQEPPTIDPFSKGRAEILAVLITLELIREFVRHGCKLECFSKDKVIVRLETALGVMSSDPPDTYSDGLRAFLKIVEGGLDTGHCTLKFEAEPNQIGETAHLGVGLCLDRNFKVSWRRDGIVDEKRNKFLTKTCESVDGCSARVQPAKTNTRAEGQPIPKKSINDLVICPQFLSDPYEAVIKVRNGFWGINDENLSTISENLENSMKRPIISEPQPRRGQQNTTMSANPEHVVPKRVGIWIRDKHDPKDPGAARRNLVSPKRIGQIQAAIHEIGIYEIILVGDKVKNKKDEDEIIKEMRMIALNYKNFPIKIFDLREFYKYDWFEPLAEINSLAYQYATYYLLYRDFGLICLIGNKSGGMDGPSFVGVPQIFFEEAKSDYAGMVTRMGKTSLCVPSFHQVVVESIDSNRIFQKNELAKIKGEIGECEKVKDCDLFYSNFRAKINGWLIDDKGTERSWDELSNAIADRLPDEDREIQREIAQLKKNRPRVP